MAKGLLSVQSCVSNYYIRLFMRVPLCACCYSWMSWQSLWQCTRSPLVCDCCGGKRDMSSLGSLIQMVIWFTVNMELKCCHWHASERVYVSTEQSHWWAYAMCRDCQTVIIWLMSFIFLMKCLCSWLKLQSMMGYIKGKVQDWCAGTFGSICPITNVCSNYSNSRGKK